MATNVRPLISMKNKYWIDKHRHYELKHFCLQYPLWKQTYEDLNDIGVSLSNIDRIPSSSNIPSDPTSGQAIKRTYYLERIKLIERVAKEADESLYDYILKAVTEGLSYTYLKARLDIPCGKDLYYDRYRRFFWLLNQIRA